MCDIYVPSLHLPLCNTITMCDICVRLTLNTPERRHSRRSGVIVVNFAQILHMLFPLLTLNKQMLTGLEIKDLILAK